MGPHAISMPDTALTWVVIAVSCMCGAAWAYEIVAVVPPTWHAPAWLRRSAHFIYRWFPIIIVPSLIVLGWFWVS